MKEWITKGKQNQRTERAEPHFQAHHSESRLIPGYTVTIYGITNQSKAKL